MSEIFFDEMEIPKPKYNLNIQSLTHGAMTGRQIEEIEKILLKKNQIGCLCTVIPILLYLEH